MFNLNENNRIVMAQHPSDMRNHPKNIDLMVTILQSQFNIAGRC